MMLDQKTILRHLKHLQSEFDYLTGEMAKGDDEYSPLMAEHQFNAEFNEAIRENGMAAKDACGCGQFGAPDHHRCSQREYIVQAHMDRKRVKSDA